WWLRIGRARTRGSGDASADSLLGHGTAAQVDVDAAVFGGVEARGLHGEFGGGAADRQPPAGGVGDEGRAIDGARAAANPLLFLHEVAVHILGLPALDPLAVHRP